MHVGVRVLSGDLSCQSEPGCPNGQSLWLHARWRVLCRPVAIAVAVRRGVHHSTARSMLHTPRLSLSLSPPTQLVPPSLSHALLDHRELAPL